MTKFTKFLHRKPRKLIAVALLVLLPLTNLSTFSASTALADTPASQTARLAGKDRYGTALQISQAGWQAAGSVVLARGDNFPDALAGAVLAHSPEVSGPLLLTESNTLTPELLAEIKRLGAQKVYLLGGTGAISAGVEQSLIKENFVVERIGGKDRYETAAKIATKAVPSANQAFLTYGESFADALSVSSYAAAQGAPLLLTESGKVPETTLAALKKLQVTSVTLVGGEGVIKPAVQTQLEKLGYTVNRLSGKDRYLTNTAVLDSLNYNTSQVYVATGENFPDALAGAVLAAQENSPIVLVPSDQVDLATSNYLSTKRTEGSAFTLLGGWGAINYGIESMVRTGSVKPRTSLQYIQGNSYTGMLDQLNTIPGNATDTVDIVSPDWYSLNDPLPGQTTADGSISGKWDDDGSNNYSQFVGAAHGRNLKVLPMLASSWSSTTAIDSVLRDPQAQAKLISQIVERLDATKADGIAIDFENMSDDNGPYLTQFMQALYVELHPRNKLVVMSVMSRTSPTAEPWNAEFNYHDLSQTVDYLQIMTYDYRISTPGPIAPLPWVEKVLTYAENEGTDMSKVLLGLPYYGRDWVQNGSGYSISGIGYWRAQDTAKTYQAEIQRDITSGENGDLPSDTVGIPYYTYTDNNKAVHYVYYDDPQSWEAKLALLDKYDLGGVGAWSLYWVVPETSNILFPLLQQHLR